MSPHSPAAVSLLLTLGCPEEKLDEAFEHLAPMMPAKTASEIVAQVRGVIEKVVGP